MDKKRKWNETRPSSRILIKSNNCFARSHVTDSRSSGEQRRGGEKENGQCQGGTTTFLSQNSAF